MTATSITTIGDLIKLTLKDCGAVGVGQTPLAEDSNDALMRLNAMLGQWNRSRWLVYHLINLSITSTGALSYTVGPGGNLNISNRPDKIEAAFARQIIAQSPNAIDYPLEAIAARETYDRIALKSLNSFPEYFFYDPAFPLGNLFVYPVASPSFQILISVKEVLTPFVSLTDNIVLPAEYFEALLYNLGARLRPAYQLEPDPTITALALASLNVIKNANAAIPTMQMPKSLKPRGYKYNIYSDTAY